MNPIEARELVCEALLALAHGVCGDAGQLTERYLHHRFSHLLQWQGLSLGLDGREAVLHPDWPTYRETASIYYARYTRKELRLTWEYEVDERGRPGILDFAVGPYAAPWAGVELILRRDWVHEEVVFDLMKLLHPAVPFQFAAALCVYLTPDRRSFRGTHSARVVIPAAYEAATGRLRRAGLGGGTRDVLALFVEVLRTGARRMWRLTRDGQAEEIPVALDPASDWKITLETCTW
jgi:hypothetical protein